MTLVGGWMDLVNYGCLNLYWERESLYLKYVSDGGKKYEEGKNDTHEILAHPKPTE